MESTFTDKYNLCLSSLTLWKIIRQENKYKLYYEKKREKKNIKFPTSLIHDCSW